MTDTDAELDYAYLTQEALRGVVRQVLSMTQALGMPPGEHHFYVEFAVDAPGVQLSQRLRAQYPGRMTIVLQHQFEALEVDEEGFAVTLHFGGAPDRLIVPYAAITQFADPSASFALQFAPPAETEADADAGEEEGRPSAEVSPLRAVRDEPSDADADEEGPDDDGPDGGGDGGGGDGGGEVVSLDRFRKK